MKLGPIIKYGKKIRLSWIADETFYRKFEKITGGKEENIEKKRNGLTINVPVVYMVRYKVVLRGDYP
jgi:hypothetical protein